MEDQQNKTQQIIHEANIMSDTFDEDDLFEQESDSSSDNESSSECEKVVLTPQIKQENNRKSFEINNFLKKLAKGVNSQSAKELIMAQTKATLSSSLMLITDYFKGSRDKKLHTTVSRLKYMKENSGKIETYVRLQRLSTARKPILVGKYFELKDELMEGWVYGRKLLRKGEFSEKFPTYRVRSTINIVKFSLTY
jgi:hypothetical protein